MLEDMKFPTKRQLKQGEKTERQTKKLPVQPLGISKALIPLNRPCSEHQSESMKTVLSHNKFRGTLEDEGIPFKSQNPMFTTLPQDLIFLLLIKPSKTCVESDRTD